MRFLSPHRHFHFPHTMGTLTWLAYSLIHSESFLGNPPASLMKIKSIGLENPPGIPTISASSALSPWILWASAFSNLLSVRTLSMFQPEYSRFLEHDSGSLCILLEEKLISNCSRFIRLDVFHQAFTRLHDLPNVSPQLQHHNQQMNHFIQFTGCRIEDCNELNIMRHCRIEYCWSGGLWI